MAHDPAWPDKAMFAALLLIIGGALGLAVEGLRAVATVEEQLPAGLAAAYPHWLSAAMSAATLVLGIFCYRTQAAVFGYAGAATGLGSLAYAGLVPFLSIVAIGMLIKSRMEGEETRNDGVTLHPGQWPDKAMAASLFMVIGAAVTLVQAVAIARGDYEPVFLAKTPGMIVDFALVGFLLVAAYQVYNLRTPWMGWVAAGAAILSFGLYLLGPAIGIIIVVLMLKAHREEEFFPDSPVVAFENKPTARSAAATSTGAASSPKRTSKPRPKR